MSYDYSSESNRLELPNPYKVENLFLFIVAAIYFLAGILTLLTAKNYLLDGKGFSFVPPLLATIFLLAVGIRFAVIAMTRLRFFFGRGLPVGLAPELPQGVIGKSQQVDDLKEDIRRGALTFREPEGALNGLLYHRVPQLIVAPAEIQFKAQVQFKNGLVIAFSLLSLLVAWLGLGSGGNHANSLQWIGLFYFALVSILVLNPLRKGSASATPVNQIYVIGLVISAVIGPVIAAYLARYLPDISWMSLQWQALFLLVASLASVGLSFMALLRQLSPPPSTALSCEQMSLNINTHPAQIMGEFDRVMQQKWVEKIPNRRYQRNDPVVDADAKAGTFSGEVVEETQPMPAVDLQPQSLGLALASERSRWLVYLDTLGLVLMVAAAIAMVIFVWKLTPQEIDKSLFSYVTFTFVAFAVGWFCFKTATGLWGRFDFSSEVIWIELSGQYTTARNRLGNDFSSTVRTESNSINIDSMTMRVWTTRIESVVFGKNTERYLIAMNGQSDVTKGLATHLAQFAASRSMFVAPNNSEDINKIAAVHAAEQMHKAPAPPSLQTLLTGQAPAAAAAPAAEPVAGGKKFCSECGAGNMATAKFCSACGHGFEVVQG